MNITAFLAGYMNKKAIELDIELGDILLGGRFKNKREVVEDLGEDDLGQPTVNGKKLLNFRIEKTLPEDKQSKETKEMGKEATGLSTELLERASNAARKVGRDDFVKKLENVITARVNKANLNPVIPNKPIAKSVNPLDKPIKEMSPEERFLRAIFESDSFMTFGRKK